MPSLLKRNWLVLAVSAILAIVVFASLRTAPRSTVGAPPTTADARKAVTPAAAPSPREVGAPLAAPSASDDSQFAARQAAARAQAEREQRARDNTVRKQARPRVEQFIRAGLIQKVDSRGLWVRPAFYELDFDQKQALCSHVYLFAFGTQRDQAFYLYDSRTGKSIGTYGYAYGGYTLALD